MPSRYERQIAVQLGLFEILTVVGYLRRKSAIPPPRVIFGASLPFCFLSLLDTADDRWQRYGKLMGWFIVLSIGLWIIPSPTPNSPDLLTWIVGAGASKVPLFPGAPGSPNQTQVD
jgi:hypothetical protein